MDRDDAFAGHLNLAESNSHFLRVHIENISISNLGFIVFLKHGRTSRVLPIFIGGNEAHSIAKVLNNQETPRPMTHDLMHQLLDTLGWCLDRIEVTHILENTFYARMYWTHEAHQPLNLDARPSDAIAMALRFQSEMWVHRSVFDQAAIPIASEIKPDIPSGAMTQVGEKSDFRKEKELVKTNPVQELQKRLARAIHEEHYEEAAKIRDALRVAIKKLQDGN